MGMAVIKYTHKIVWSRWIRDREGFWDFESMEDLATSEEHAIRLVAIKEQYADYVKSHGLKIEKLQHPIHAADPDEWI